MKRLIFIYLSFCFSTFAQNVELVKDIKTTGSEINSFGVSGNSIYYLVPELDYELWKNDGTVGGNTRLSNPIPMGGQFVRGLMEHFKDANGNVFFKNIFYSPEKWELWKSNGTFGSLSLLKTFNETSKSKLYDLGSSVFFASNDNVSVGNELWKSDGTSLGTALFKDVFLGASSSNPVLLEKLNNQLYFTALGTNGLDLWKTDGTLANTVFVKNLSSNSNYLAQENAIVVNGLLYFTVNTGASNQEIWSTDGSSLNTIKVASYCKDVLFVNYQNQLYYTTTISNGNSDLWKSNGTLTGTSLISSFNYRVIESEVSMSKIFLAAADNVNFIFQLRTSDGTVGNDLLVKEFDSGSTYFANLTDVNNTLYFTINDVTNGEEVYVSDGTELGTVLLKDIATGLDFLDDPASSYPNMLTKVNNSLYFLASENSIEKLFKSNGTTIGTETFSIFNGSSLPYQLINFNNNIAFTARDDIHQQELWTSDGSTTGTALVKDINNLNTSDFYSKFTVCNNLLFFAVGSEIWRSDGTLVGTFLLNGPTPNFEGNLDCSCLGNTLVFAGKDANGTELWKTDGSNPNTVLLKDILAGSNSSIPTNFITINGVIYFGVYGTGGAKELWKTDGTASGTVMVKSFGLVFLDFLDTFTPFGSILYFRVGNQLWKSDGTEVGTVLLKSFNSLNSLFKVVNGILYFGANFNNQYGLWKSDGTVGGTISVKNMSYTLQNFAELNGNLFFSLYESATGSELWKSDGTLIGTVMVKDINPITGASGIDSNSPNPIYNFDGALYFSANDGVNGTELWKSDGTNAGTALFADINPVGNSNPKYLVKMGTYIYFQAKSTTLGKELYRINLVNGIFESITTGNWNTGSTWISPTNTLLPSASSATKINSTHIVTIPNTGNEVKTIQMNGGVINLNGGTLEIKNQ